jgi:hypothetical protein
MRYCFQCGRITSGGPLFCNFCGRSFDVRLCPRLHVNPRIAKTCSQCGSSDLSKPQPKVSLWWHVLAFLARVLLGGVLVWLSISVAVVVIEELLKRPEVQMGMIVIGLLLVGLWFLWAMLPHWIRKVIRRLLEKKERSDER